MATSWRNLLRHLPSSFRKENGERSMFWWKRISLIVALPVVTYLTIDRQFADMEHKEKLWPNESLRNTIVFLWDNYLYEDPVKREAARDEHLRSMQEKHRVYLIKKQMPEKPIQPYSYKDTQARRHVNKVDCIYNTL